MCGYIILEGCFDVLLFEINRVLHFSEMSHWYSICYYVKLLVLLPLDKVIVNGLTRALSTWLDSHALLALIHSVLSTSVLETDPIFLVALTAQGYLYLRRVFSSLRMPSVGYFFPYVVLGQCRICADKPILIIPAVTFPLRPSY